MFDVRNCPLPSPSTRTGGRSLDLIGVSQATSAMSDRVGMGGAADAAGLHLVLSMATLCDDIF